jgi:hypothetical protein
LARGDAELKRTPLKRTPPKQRQRQPRDVLAAIHLRSRGKCVVCGKRCDVRRDRHHVLAVQRWPELECHPDNQVLACIACHAAHELASRRILWHELPQCAITLAYATSGAAAVYLERTYPR